MVTWQAGCARTGADVREKADWAPAKGGIILRFTPAAKTAYDSVAFAPSLATICPAGACRHWLRPGVSANDPALQQLLIAEDHVRSVPLMQEMQVEDCGCSCARPRGQSTQPAVNRVLYLPGEHAVLTSHASAMLKQKKSSPTNRSVCCRVESISALLSSM